MHFIYYVVVSCRYMPTEPVVQMYTLLYNMYNLYYTSKRIHLSFDKN